MLDAKLESHDSEKWYSGVEKQASGIADALSVRLKSFSRRVQQIKEAPSALELLKDTASSGINGQALVGNLYSPIEQGVACLRVLLKSIEASMSTDGDQSPWIKQDVDRQWRLPNIFPENWRLLSLSIHITRLVAKKVDYDTDDVEEVDWENMIGKTFSDLTLRAISGASACRGLLHGKANLKKICAVGLAMFIEVEATTPSDGPKQMFFEKDPNSAFDAGKAITEGLWSELDMEEPSDRTVNPSTQ
ncbi:hypothetical protein BJ912DRAFT_475517 [Pholiota molesta]|nr:hypothetical protein BJ912DRAFT_475517 [Pholiota molesta]